jgi:hypothetical protein
MIMACDLYGITIFLAVDRHRLYHSGTISLPPG